MKKLVLILFSIITVIAVILFIIFNFVVTPKKYNYYVEKYAEKYSLEPELVYAIIKVESNYDKNAISSAGAMGLMQIIPKTGAWIAGELNENFSKEELINEETNIKYGCFYLNYLFSKFNSLDAVICAYNAGETVVRGWLNETGEVDENKITYAETKNYYKKVLEYYNTYKNSENYQ